MDENTNIPREQSEALKRLGQAVLSGSLLHEVVIDYVADGQKKQLIIDDPFLLSLFGKAAAEVYRRRFPEK